MIQLSGKLTIVLVTHNLFQAKRVAHEMVLMMDGQVVENGHTDRLFFKPRRQETADFVAGKTW
ncbi:MAG: hypothetical protein ACYCX4_14920 [Bacillota bacterium]